MSMQNTRGLIFSFYVAKLAFSLTLCDGKKFSCFCDQHHKMYMADKKL